MASEVASSDGASPTNRATPQGGILEGQDPSVYDSKNPITLFIVQVCFPPPPSSFLVFGRPGQSSRARELESAG